jgi:hypothetical protein
MALLGNIRLPPQKTYQGLNTVVYFVPTSSDNRKKFYYLKSDLLKRKKTEKGKEIEGRRNGGGEWRRQD